MNIGQNRPYFLQTDLLLLHIAANRSKTSFNHVNLDALCLTSWMREWGLSRSFWWCCRMTHCRVYINLDPWVLGGLLPKTIVQYSHKNLQRTVWTKHLCHIVIVWLNIARQWSGLFGWIGLIITSSHTNTIVQLGHKDWTHWRCGYYVLHNCGNTKTLHSLEQCNGMWHSHIIVLLASDKDYCDASASPAKRARHVHCCWPIQKVRSARMNDNT